MQIILGDEKDSLEARLSIADLKPSAAQLNDKPSILKHDEYSYPDLQFEQNMNPHYQFPDIEFVL